MLRGLYENQRSSILIAAGLRGENMPIVPTCVIGNSIQQTPLLRVRSVFEGAWQVVQNCESGPSHIPFIRAYQVQAWDYFRVRRDPTRISRERQ
jgi:hypothetical protein